MKTFDISPAPFWPARTHVRRIMLLVLAALLPGTLAHVCFFGPGILIQIALATFFALVIESVMLHLRGQPIATFLTDGSAWVTAWLFALCIPPLSPWWIAAVGMFVAIAGAKHLYGGLGSNLFNPAMAGYAVVLVCFPLELSRWLPPAGVGDAGVGFVEALRIVLTGIGPTGDWDAITRATPLDVVRSLSRGGQTLTEISSDPMFGNLGAAGWEWIALAIAAGGIGLCILRVVDWRTPVSVILATFVFTLPFWLADSDLHPSPLQQLFSGGLMLAAFFIATDPVSGCTTPRGRWFFGAGVALLTLVIRRWGAYPDGIAFAVLLMNAAAPLIDRLTPPRIFGR